MRALHGACEIHVREIFPWLCSWLRSWLRNWLCSRLCSWLSKYDWQNTESASSTLPSLAQRRRTVPAVRRASQPMEATQRAEKKRFAGHRCAASCSRGRQTG